MTVNKYYTLPELSRIVNLPVYRLQRVVDEQLLPPKFWYDEEEGPRKPPMLNQQGACLVTAAALMLDFGVRPETVQACFENVDDIRQDRLPRHNPFSVIESAFLGNDDALLLFADRTHLRCIVGKIDSKWRKIGKKMVAEPSYSPAVTITVNIGKIRDLIN